MVDAKLYSSALSYPTIQAVAGSKLSVEKTDFLTLRIECASIKLEASRATTSDPWLIEDVRVEEAVELVFSRGAVTIDSDNLNWKAMADLALKAHQRATGDQTWPLVGKGVGSNIPLWKPDASKDSGFVSLSVDEAKAVISARVDQAGDIAVDFDPKSTGYRVATPGATELAVANMIAKIVADTTHTSLGMGTEPCITNTSVDNGATGSKIGAGYRMLTINGTEGLSIGNYSGGEMEMNLTVAAYNSNKEVKSIRHLKTDEVAIIPSIQLDKMRRASAVGAWTNLDLTWLSGTNAFTVQSYWGNSGWGGDSAGTVVMASIANPSGMYEVDFDQVNSLDVLATAAFAGIGGVAATGVQAALESTLANSALGPTFSQLATVLGTTTAALISGYAAALVAAYANGWISNDQLFDLGNHVSWLSQGATTIAAAATAGVAVGSVNSLLNYLGVNNSVLSTALTAVGGAASASGVALGMASVMSKVVRHSYWGE